MCSSDLKSRRERNGHKILQVMLLVLEVSSPDMQFVLPFIYCLGKAQLTVCLLRKESRDFKYQAPVVRKADSAIHRINHYQADSVVCFVNTYPLDSDLSGGYRYPSFEQPGPGVRFLGVIVDRLSIILLLFR